MYTYPRFRFYRGELLELALATLAVYAVFLSELGWFISLRLALYIFLLSFLVYVPHELAHKFSALYFGYPARFKLIPEFFILTLVSTLLPFKIIVPGTVLITAFSVTRRTMGVISAMGPSTNLVIALASMAVGGPYARVLADISAWIAFFNLIPFGPLDGKKVLDWNPILWILLIALSGFMAFL